MLWHRVIRLAGPLLTLPWACAALAQILPPPYYPDPHFVNNGHHFGGGGMWAAALPAPGRGLSTGELQHSIGVITVLANLGTVHAQNPAALSLVPPAGSQTCRACKEVVVCTAVDAERAVG